MITISVVTVARNAVATIEQTIRSVAEQNYPHIEHIGDYLAVAQQANSPIVAIFETHVQADHLSGAPQLATATRAPIYLHESAQVQFPFTPLRDGDVVELGNDYVRVLHTPGHSSDSISLVVGDRVRTDAPWLAFTGDTLFVGDWAA
jgi:glyoxylase-like metal-dependent hydrolase (beta-lactamase superfamily II)